MIYELVPELKEQERGKLKSELFPLLENVIFIGDQHHRGMYNIPEILEMGKGKEPIDIALNCHEVINMQYTSGTTGFPKGVMLSHYNIINNGLYIGRRQKFTSEEILCLPVPLFHCFGIVLGV
jgi:fatty-acyl-CoA synthase